MWNYRYVPRRELSMGSFQFLRSSPSPASISINHSNMSKPSYSFHWATHSLFLASNLGLNFGLSLLQELGYYHSTMPTRALAAHSPFT